jgi:hypothetical protein
VLTPTGCWGDPNTCGNGTIDTEEDCDGQNLRGATCTDLDPIYTGGTLRCGDNCRWDIQRCVTHGTCGNGVVDPGEDCEPFPIDPTTLVPVQCSAIPPHRGIGTLECDAVTCKYEFDVCDDVKPVCGNGIREGEEACDGSDRYITSCVDLGAYRFRGGFLRCREDCTLDISQCFDCGGAHCGDGVAESGENCDGSDFKGKTCQSLGWSGGHLKCYPSNCEIDTTACTGCVPNLRGGFTCQ